MAGELDWASALDFDDLAMFLAEAGAAAAAFDLPALRKCLHDWRRTAEALSDPARREVLTGPHAPEDFTEVQRPGSA